MKMIICLAALIAVASCLPVETPDVQVLRFTNDAAPDGGYKYGFETSDGTSRDETGEITNAGTDDEAIEVRGSFKYTGSDGVVYTINYTAGKDGFVPVGDHIPKE